MNLLRRTAAAAALVWCGAAQAQSVTSSLGATMTITAGCTVSGGTVAFGTQSSLAANIDQSGTVTVTCTNTTPYTVALDKGVNGTSVTARKMKGGATNTEFITYALYTSSGRSSNWGQTVGTDTVAGTGSGSAQTLTVYGRVPPQTIGSPGSYTDAVTITVSY